MNRISKYFLFIWCVFVSFSAANAQGCAMCKAAVENGVGNEGFNDAIIYLMLFPYIIAFAGVGLFIYLLNKKKAEQ